MEVPILLDSIISGVIQGATELLPISSTGHLLLFSSLTGISLALSDIAIMHLGTLGSILIAFREKLKELRSVHVLITIAISALPAASIGFLFEHWIGSTFGSPSTISLSLAVWGIVIICTDRWSRNRLFHTSSLSQISLSQAVIVGAAQILALIPGTSRSGITTIAGIMTGMSPATALTFSFFSGIPLLAGSGLYGLTKNFTAVDSSTVGFPMITLAAIISAGVGIGAAYILKRGISKGILTICGFYRILVSMAIAATILL